MIHILNRKIPNVFYTLQKSIFNNYKLVKSFPDNPKIYYCGRPSILGNPFSHLNNSIAKYKCKKEYVLFNFENYLLSLPKFSRQIVLINNIKEESKNIDVCLECWCVPKPCHCEIILRNILENKI